MEELKNIENSFDELMQQADEFIKKMKEGADNIGKRITS